MNADAVAGAALLALSVAFWLGANAIRESSLSGGVGADGLPKLLAVALGLLAVVLVIQSLAARRTAAREGPPSAADPRQDGGTSRHLLAAGVLGIGAAYVAVLPYAGYLVSVALLLLAVALYYGRRLSLGTVAFAALGALAFHLIFVVLLDVRMPAGPWPDLLARA